MIRNHEWYAGNAVRAYPLSDAATTVDDAGQFLPHDILVDCQLAFPNTLGQAAFVSAVAVSARLVQCFSGCRQRDGIEREWPDRGHALIVKNTAFSRSILKNRPLFQQVDFTKPTLTSTWKSAASWVADS